MVIAGPGGIFKNTQYHLLLPFELGTFCVQCRGVFSLLLFIRDRDLDLDFSTAAL